MSTAVLNSKQRSPVKLVTQQDEMTPHPFPDHVLSPETESSVAGQFEDQMESKVLFDLSQNQRSVIDEHK